MKYILTFIVFVISATINAENYKLECYHPMSKEMTFFNALAINDNGSIVISFRDLFGDGHLIINRNKEVHFCEIDAYFPKITGFNTHNNFAARQYVYSRSKKIIPYFYDFKNGIQYFDVFNSNIAYPIDMNDNNQIIGYYQIDGEKERPFYRLIDDDCHVRVIDLGVGSDLTKKTIFKGTYSISDVKILSINNKDQILGYFLGSRLNNFGEIELSGYFPFIYDLTNLIEILPIVEQENRLLSKMQMNNNGMIIMHRGQGTILWMKKDYKYEKILIENFRFIAFNDSGTILGQLSNNDPAIWTEGKVIPFDKNNVDLSTLDPIPPIVHQDSFIKRSLVYKDINNKGQILCEFSHNNTVFVGILNPIEE